MADSVINTLHIKDVRLEDFGEYNCSARNQYGLDSAVGQLAQLDAVPLYLLVPGVIAGGVLVLLLAIAVCMMRARASHNNGKMAFNGEVLSPKYSS